ncbi:MAG: hypothetical protein WCS94_21860, partial [Verrucomicrobiota bacterium]
GRYIGGGLQGVARSVGGPGQDDVVACTGDGQNRGGGGWRTDRDVIQPEAAKLVAEGELQQCVGSRRVYGKGNVGQPTGGRLVRSAAIVPFHCA